MKKAHLILHSILVQSILDATSFSFQRRYRRKIGQRECDTFSMSSLGGEMSHNLSLPLSGKTAFITGSSGGIGKAIAKSFATAGADVILNYNLREDGAVRACEDINDAHKDAITSLPSERGERNTPGKCRGIVHADFRDPKEVQTMFRSVLHDILQGNRLDILINNAGIVTKLAVEDDDDDLSMWHETMAINLHAPLQLMRLAHGHMKSEGGGVIINNSSVHGSRSVEFMNAYAASKAALDSLTRGLALEYAKDGVRVNAVAPGVVPVERTADAFSDQNVVNMWTPHIPAGRLGTVDDIADATILLATNKWMTGSILTVDGGMMARANMPIRPRPPK